MTSTKLKEYLYTILSLENQIYTYQRAEEIYIKKIRKIEEDKNTVFLNDKEDYKRRKFHRSNQVVPAPDAKPNYIGEKKTRRGRKEFIYGFNGLNDMYRQIPERWMEGELGLLYKKEHNKFRNKHVLVWICACVLGILLSFLVSNILPLPIAVLIAIFLSYKIGNENQIEYTPGNEVYDTFMHIYTQNYNADLKLKKKCLHHRYVNSQKNTKHISNKIFLTPQEHLANYMIKISYIQNIRISLLSHNYMII
mgnify:CR=1 FL=1